MKKLDENTAGNKRVLYGDYYDGKNVLRQAMKDILPERIINRKNKDLVRQMSPGTAVKTLPT